MFKIRNLSSMRRKMRLFGHEYIYMGNLDFKCVFFFFFFLYKMWLFFLVKNVALYRAEIPQNVNVLTCNL